MPRLLTSLVISGGLAAALALPVAGVVPATAAEAEAAVHTQAARIETIPGSPFRKVALTDKAARRLNIQVVEVAEDQSGTRVVPYSAIVYDLKGTAFVYTNPETLVFVRSPVTVARIDGSKAYLKEGPPAGTRIATIGVPQLYGAEKGVGH